MIPLLIPKSIFRSVECSFSGAASPLLYDPTLVSGCYTISIAISKLKEIRIVHSSSK